MTIDKAIEILNNHQVDLCLTPATDLRDALKLGIEALREVQGLRENVLVGIWLLLPGETKE